VREVLRVIEPIWKSKPETASRLRGRIERVLSWAKVRGYRSGDNPAGWRGVLQDALPERRRSVRHHAAVAIDEMPAVYQRLSDAPDIGSLAVRFVILTAARAGEVLGATWDEIDFSAQLWAVPAERMKAERAHRIPLSVEALAVLRRAKSMKSKGALIFPGHRFGRPLSHTALIKALRRAGADRATTHGCRSTFKDWASECTSFPTEVSEMALAHTIANRTEAAYRRGELLEKRRALMDQWCKFVLSPDRGEVVSIGTLRRRVRR
jgi:integrase